MQQISESVQSMRNIVHDDSTISGQTFSLARPIAAFAANALLPMDFIITLKQNAPNRISLIHAVILSHEKLVMAKSSEIQLRQSSIPFEEFKAKFLHQDVKVPQTIGHIHILSYDGITMELIFLHKTELYLVAKTNELDLIKDIVNQIISKETLI